jgi:hypothetical protein
MATTFEVNIDVNSASLNELNKEFERLNTLAKDLPKNSKGFDQVAASAQKVGTAIEKTNTKLSGLKVDEKADLAVKAFRGLLGGVQAVSAAFIAFGADASAIEGAEKKLLGVFSVVDGLGDAAQGAVAVQKLLGISFTQTGVAAEGAAVGVNSFKTALITTGIGAIIVGLGLLVALLIDTSDEAEAASKGIDDLRKSFQNNIDVLQNEAIFIKNNTELKRNALNFDKKSAKERSKVRQDELKALESNLDKEDAALTDYYIKLKKFIKDNVKDEKERAKELNKLKDEIAAKEEDILKRRTENTQAQNLEILRLAQELADQQQEILDNEIAAINANNDVKRQLAEELTTSEKQAALTRFNNTKQANAEQLTEELKAENLSGTAKANIRAKYRNLDKLAEIQLQKEIAQIANNALKNQNDLQLAAANETFSALINQLDFFYDEVFAQYKNLNTNDIFKVFFGEDKQQRVFDYLNNVQDINEYTIDRIAESTEQVKKFFAALGPLERNAQAAKIFFKDFYNGLVDVYKEQAIQVEKFSKTGRQGILDEAEFFVEQNRNKAESTVVFLQQQQLAQNDYYVNERVRLEKALNDKLITEEQYNDDLAKLQFEQEKSFDSFQERKKQVIENAAKNEVQITQNKNKKLEALDKQLLQISRNVEDLKLNQIEDQQQKEEALLKSAYNRSLIDAEGNEELKLALAEEYLIKLALLRKKFREEEETEIQAAALKIFDLQQQFFNQLSALESTKAQNDLDRELYALNKRTAARIKAAGDDAEAVGRIEQDSLEMEDSLRKKAFENEKLRKLALARINTAAAVLSILAETPKGDFGIATALLIAGAIATGELQAAAIRDTTYIPTFAQGGLVTGPGTSTSDSILARLSSGEFVVNAKSTQRFLPVLNTLNNTPNNNQLSQTIDSSGSSPMFRTYVLAGDVTSAQAAEARLNQKRKL